MGMDKFARGGLLIPSTAGFIPDEEEVILPPVNIKGMLADVVQVVRCKDCKHRGDYPCPLYHEELVEWDDDGYSECDLVQHDKTTDNGFCHMGELGENDYT